MIFNFLLFYKFKLIFLFCLPVDPSVRRVVCSDQKDECLKEAILQSLQETNRNVQIILDMKCIAGIEIGSF